jgi:signal transduction histidine kinase/ligand-binding sensor domain-containing protein
MQPVDPLMIGAPVAVAPPARHASATRFAGRCAGFFLLMLCAGGEARAQAADTPCDCYALTVWSNSAGLPSHTVQAITQDREGYLWLGTEGGLVRFNGLQFEPWDAAARPLSGDSVAALITARDGSVWVGFIDSGGVSRIKDGRVTNMPRPKQDDTRALLEDRSGTIWAGGRQGLMYFRDGAWQGPVASGLPNGPITSVYEDQAGGFWVGTGSGVYVRPRGGDVFELRDARPFVVSIAQDRDGIVWANDSQQVVRSLGALQPLDVGPGIQLPAGGWRLLPDGNGTLWVAALGEGLIRVRPGGHGRRLERVRYEHKIARSAQTLYLDRERNFWVGLRGGGLVRISETPVQTGIELEGMTNDGVRALAALPDGSVWVATGRSLNRFAGGSRRAFDSDRTMAMHTSGDGRLWVVTGVGAGLFDERGFHPEPIPPGVRYGRVVSLTTDPAGGLWLCSNEQGALRWHGGRLDTFGSPAVSNRPCNAVYSDKHGRVWVAFAAGGTAVYDNGTFRTYTVADGLAEGRIEVFHEDRRGAIWMSSASGLTRLRDGVLTTVTSENGLPEAIAPSILEDGDGNLWLGVRSGAAVVRVSPAEIDRAAAEPGYQIDYLLYDETDGLEPSMWRRLGRPTAVRGGDGRLWFASGSGLAVIDPRRLPARQNVARPRIDRIVVNGHADAPEQRAVLPGGTETLQVQFSALSLTSASKLRFRYRLDGLEQQWRYAGAQQHATYAGLTPGDYRFRLAAAADGAWSQQEAVWSFRVPPPFYRTGGFYAAAASAMALMVWAAWWLRLRSVKNAYALAFEERARVSREIHDTLLQSLGGVALELEAVAVELDAASLRSTGDGVRRLRRQVSRGVVEARRSIAELRSPALQTHGLPGALRDIGQRAADGKSLNIQVSVVGRARRLPPSVEEQLLRIGQEAMTNAVRHAMAGNIDLVLEYHGDTITLRVSDDGCGFDVEQRQDDGTHWGLTNMMERAKKLGTRLGLRSRPGHGTVVEVTASTAGGVL